MTSARKPGLALIAIHQQPRVRQAGQRINVVGLPLQRLIVLGDGRGQPCLGALIPIVATPKMVMPLNHACPDFAADLTHRIHSEIRARRGPVRRRDESVA